MKLLIIEDEPLVAKGLQKLILQLMPEAHIVGLENSISSATNWLNSHPHPDLILSDIQLSDGISFEIFENNTIQCPIIFTTAYDEFAIRAFKLNSIDYLLKPIEKKELEKALQKYQLLHNSLAGSVQLQQMIREFQLPVKKYKDRFLCVYKNALVPIQTDQIAYFHKEELIFVHTRANEKLISEFNAMDEIESLLDPGLFFRANRQYLLHLEAVEKVRPTHKGLTVTLKVAGAIEVDISREKATEFKKWLDR